MNNRNVDEESDSDDDVMTRKEAKQEISKQKRKYEAKISSLRKELQEAQEDLKHAKKQIRNLQRKESVSEVVCMVCVYRCQILSYFLIEQNTQSLVKKKLTQKMEIYLPMAHTLNL